jgi:hypothetical protein
MKDDPKTRPFDLATDARLIEEGCDTSALLMVIIELARALGAPEDFSAGDRFLHWRKFHAHKLLEEMEKTDPARAASILAHLDNPNRQYPFSYE